MESSRWIGENIRALRKERNYTQQYVADKAGVTKQTISKIEKTGQASGGTLSRIANALFVDVKDFYERQEKPSQAAGINLFYDAQEKDAILFEFAEPMLRRVNDTVARNYTQRIAQECSRSAKEIESTLESKGYQKPGGYTRAEVVDICQKQYAEFILMVYKVFNG